MISWCGETLYGLLFFTFTTTAGVDYLVVVGGVYIVYSLMGV